MKVKGMKAEALKPDKMKYFLRQDFSGGTHFYKEKKLRKIIQFRMGGTGK